MTKLRVLFLAVLIFSPAIYAQDFAPTHSKIRKAADERDYAVAIAGLKNLEAADKNIFRLNNYDYLLARLHEKNGDFAAAMANYQMVAGRDSVLKEYALWHLSQIARTSGNLMLERTYLQELIAFSPQSLLHTASKNRLARSWFESKNYESAIKLLNDLAAGASQPQPAARPAAESSIIRENRLLLAEAYLQSGNTSAATDHFTSLIDKLSNPAQPDDFALGAVKGLDLIGAGQTTLSDYEHLRRANIYQFNRDFAGARLHFTAIINNHPSSGIVPDAIYQIGRGYTQQSNFTEAIKWYERVQELHGEHQASKDALLQAASAYSRVARFNEAIVRYRKYIDKYPNDDRLDRAYLNIVDTLRDQGEEAEALKWAAKTQEIFRGKPPEAIALFTETRIYLARSDWENSLKNLDRLLTFPDLGGSTVPGGTNTAEITFLKGFVLEQMRRFGEAIDVYISIPDGRAEYYGWRATERLKLLADDETAKPLIEGKLSSLSLVAAPKDFDAQRKNTQAALRLTGDPALRENLLDALQKVYANLPAYKKIPAFVLRDAGRKSVISQKPVSDGSEVHKLIANELLFLGLYDEAAPEFEASLAIRAPLNLLSNDTAYSLALFYKRGDIANRAVAYAEPLWRGVPADYQIELIPREQIELLYPAPYADAFAKHAVPRAVDPRYLLSIMRQESRYRADVKSYAAARGLMQFISTTSDKIAGELGRENFRQDELYDPATAILFGSQYTANLFKLFPNQPQAVAASYNGGEDNMKRWLGRAKSDLPDRYVPEIAFSQSKDYVYKVMANYRVYQIFYDEGLKNREVVP